MIDPGTAAIVAGALKAGSDAMSSSSASKKKSKEDKRRTMADYWNALLNRAQDQSKDVRAGQRDLAKAQANVLQNIASQYVQS